MAHKIVPKTKELEPIEETSENHLSRRNSGDQLHGDEDFRGPVALRACTDLPCLLAFVIMTFGFIAMAVFSNLYTVALMGDPQRTIYGYDFRGEVCGVGGLKDRRFMYFPTPSNLDFSLCVSACPYYYVRDYYCVYDTDHSTCMSDYPLYSTLESTVVSYYCVPWSSPEREDVLDLLYSPMWVLKRAAGDVYMSWSALMLGLIVSSVLGLLYLSLFRHVRAVKFLIWFSLVLSVSLTVVLAWLFYENYQKVKVMQADEKLCGDYGPVTPEDCILKGAQVYYAFFALTLLVAAGILVRLYASRKHLKVSSGLLSLTGQPLHSLPQFFAYPLFHLLSGIGVITVLATIYIYTLGLASVTTVYHGTTPGGESRILEYNMGEKALFAFVCLMCLLWLAFLGSVYEFVLSYAVATWYFCREKSMLYVSHRQAPIYRAGKACIRYHLGSLVYHSFMKLAVGIPVLLIRPFFSYAYSNRSHIRLRQCFLIRFYETNLRKYTVQGVAYLALFGDRFGVSAEKALALSNRNFARMGLPLAWGTYLTFCYKVTIGLMGVCLAYGLVLLGNALPGGRLAVEITLQPAVCFLAFLLSFFAAEVFAGAMETSLKTVLFCASCDEEMFTSDQRFITAELQSFLDQVAEEQNEIFREMAFELTHSKNNRLDGLEGQDGVVKDEDWEEGVGKGPRNQAVRNNFRPLYYQHPDTASTKRSTPETPSEAPPQVASTMRAGQIYARPEASGTPSILITPPASTGQRFRP